MKTKKRAIIIALTLVLLVASVGLAAAMMIPSAADLMTQALETLETIGEGHAVIEVTAELPDRTMSATFEAWGKLNQGPNGEPAMRVEVLAASQAELVGLTAVSDGAQFWLYTPSRNQVITGRAEELAPLLKDKLAEHAGDLPYGGNFDPETAEMPETPEEAVAKLLEYFSATRDGQEVIGETQAYKLRLVPIPEQMPDEFRAAGGYLNLWLRESDQLPLAAEFAENALGYAKIQATQAEINSGLEDGIFTFIVPDGVEVLQAIDLLAELEAHQESAESADFEPLEPAYLPEGATAEGSQQVAGALVQRFSLPDGRSFFLAQGGSMPLDAPEEATSSESVVVRGVEGTLFSNEAGDRTLLAWQEADLTIVIGGDLSPDQALAIAEGLQ